jgi:carbon storage regulator
VLVLTRKLGESVTIGDDVKISVIDIKGRQVRLGIEAPDHYIIHREEIYAKIQEENRRAAEHRSVDLGKVGALLKQKNETVPPKKDSTKEDSK